MLRNRRWLVIAGLVVAQVGIIAFYQGFLRGSPDSPASPGCCAASPPQTVEPAKPFDPPSIAHNLPPSITISSPQPLPPDPLPAPSAAAYELPPPPANLGPAPLDPSPLPPVANPNAALVPVQAVATEPPPPPVNEPTPVPVTPPAPATESPIPPSYAPPSPPPVGYAPPLPPDSGRQEPVAPPIAPIAPPSPQLTDPPARLGTPETMIPDPMPQPNGNWSNPQSTPLPPVRPCPWMLKMTIVDGLTVMEASIGKEIQFRVVCEKLDLASPRGIISAQGDVKISGSGLDGHCQRLLINWSDDRLLVEGDAYLKCLRDGHDVELNAERMSLRLSESSAIKGVGKTKEPPAEELSEPKESSKTPTKPPSPYRAE